MSEAKKERKMTAKGFLHKASTKAANAAAGFLAAHRAFLETGELAEFTSPVLAKLDSKEILPTPALDAIKAIVLGHMLAMQVKQAEDQIAKGEQEGKSKPWTATIYNAKGEICTRVNDKGEVEDLIKTFETGSDADRWVDRRLVDGCSDWFGVVQGHGTETTIMRQDALQRALKAPKGPATRKVGSTSSSLGFKAKAVQDRCYFSRG